MERLLGLTHLTADGDLPLLPLPITRSFITNVHDFSKGRQYSPRIDLREYATILPTVFKSLHSTSNITSDRTVIIDFLTVVILALLVVVLLAIWFYRFWSRRHTLYVVLEIGYFATVYAFVACH